MRLDPALDVLAKRGREREEKFLDEARAAGRRVGEFPGEPLGGVEELREADRLTLEAMRDRSGDLQVTAAPSLKR